MASLPVQSSLSPSPSPSPPPPIRYPVLPPLVETSTTRKPVSQLASSTVSEARIPIEQVRADNLSDGHDDNDSDEEEEGDEDDEPKLKYSRLTKSLGGVYRNGDAVSCTWVGGDKMIIGTHNGHVHILSLPSLHPLRTYKVHSASITSISVSPPPPPPQLPISTTIQQLQPASYQNIYIGTSSIDGHVCITPLSALLPTNTGSGAKPHTATKDILLKNFSRPLLSVALSPNYGVDKVYLTGGLSSKLILSQHDKPGTKLTSSTVITSGATSGSGWGLPGIPIPGIPWGGHGEEGKDVILASGEGSVSLIRFSRETPRYIAWACEAGVKIMRSHIFFPGEKERLASSGGLAPGAKHEWKRISAIERPDSVSEEMVGVIKARVEWIDGRELSKDLEEIGGGAQVNPVATPENQPGWEGGKERLLVGWGDTVWVMNIYSGEGIKDESKKWGWGEIVNKLQTDCIISGLSLYSPNQLLLLAHITAPQGSTSAEAGGSSPAPQPARRHGGISGAARQIAASPELRIISLTSSEELSADSLMMSRFESLSCNDYHLNVLPATPKLDLSLPHGEQGFYGNATEFLAGAGAGLWAAGVTATTIFSSAASVRSFGSGTASTTRPETPRPSFSWSPTLPSLANSLRSIGGISKVMGDPAGSIPVNGWADMTGRKIYITSPYDVVFATERGLKDHLGWLLEHERYQEAWDLVHKSPETINGEQQDQRFVFDQDNAASQTYDTDNEDTDSVAVDTDSDDRSTLRKVKPKRGPQLMFTAAEKEKRRIGELWVGKLVGQTHWSEAADVCGKVLGTSGSWEHWVWVFEAAGKVKEITPYVPRELLIPPLPSAIYESILGYWLREDRNLFKQLLLDTWGVNKGLFDCDVVVDLVRHRVKGDEEELEDIRQRRANQYRGWKLPSRGKDKEDDEDVRREAQVEQSWRLLQLCLANLYLAMKHPREALACYMRLKSEPEVMSLITDYHLVDAVKDDIANLLMLKITKEQLASAPMDELKELTGPAVDMLVAEAGHGIVGPERVVQQLDDAPGMEDGRVLLFFYLRKLWEVDRQLVEDSWADLAIQLWAEYDRALLMEFLKSSQGYSLEKAAQICESRSYIPELVHLLSKTGQTKRALYLIIDKLHDVAQAIAFAKQQDEKELWDDLISYSMDKPDFVRGLLENVGVSTGGMEVVKLVRGIPEGLKVPGLKGAIQKVLREYAVQWSVAEGVARVLRGEVHYGMDVLKRRSRRGVKFDVGIEQTMPGQFEAAYSQGAMCNGCQRPFEFNEKDTLLSFPCGHLFHLKCLLNTKVSSADEDEDEEGVQTPTRTSSEPIENLTLPIETLSSGRSVSTKVTHAALLKEKLASSGGRSQCTICKKKKEEGDTEK